MNRRNDSFGSGVWLWDQESGQSGSSNSETFGDEDDNNKTSEEPHLASQEVDIMIRIS